MRPIVLSAAALALLFAAGAHATLLADWDLEELVKRSDRIVIGTIESRETLVAEGKSIVMTESRVRVERTLMGSEEPVLVLSQLGGRKGSVVTEVVGDARLQEGERVLLFTFKHEDGRRYLVGMALGAWSVGPDKTSFEQTITTHLVTATGELKPPPGRRTLTLDEVKAAIEKVAAAGSPATSLDAEAKPGQTAAAPAPEAP